MPSRHDNPRLEHQHERLFANLDNWYQTDFDKTTDSPTSNGLSLLSTVLTTRVQVVAALQQ